MVKKFGDNCLQLLWEDPQTILMCFKYYIKKMDIRTSEVVRTWDTSNYEELLMCCSSDNQYTFMTGYSKVILWDQRQSDAIQTYTMEHDDKSISALEFDNSHIYVVKHEDLYELDFTGKQHFDHKKIKKWWGSREF
nr:PREDICTED: uncharacterized protein LOC105670154 [Linepithema humile]